MFGKIVRYLVTTMYISIYIYIRIFLSFIIVLIIQLYSCSYSYSWYTVIYSNIVSSIIDWKNSNICKIMIENRIIDLIGAYIYILQSTYNNDLEQS